MNSNAIRAKFFWLKFFSKKAQECLKTNNSKLTRFRCFAFGKISYRCGEQKSLQSCNTKKM